MQLKNRNLPLLSIIVPSYNEENHIGECLRSVKQQTYGKLEIIVIDDGSTDRTKSIAAQYADVLIQQEHTGPGIARNKAARVARGEILVFIDADMYLDKDYMKNIIKPILEGKAGATFTKEEYVANPQNIWSRCFQIDNNMPLLERINRNGGNISKRFRAIKKNLFVKSQGYLVNIGYGEDEVLGSKSALAAPGAICYHYNPDSLEDVFFSARWVGRSVYKKRNLSNFLKYSSLNSVVISIKKISNGAPFLFLIYKTIFDFGVFLGILDKNAKMDYSK